MSVPTCVMPAQGAATAAANTDAGNGANAAAGVASSRASADTAVRPGPTNTSLPSGSAAAETTPVNAAVKRDVAQAGVDHDGATPSDFAALLAATSNIDSTAITATASTPASTPAESNATDSAMSALPDQFLALLSGSLAMPAATVGNGTAPPMLPSAATNNGVAGDLPLAAAPPVTASAATGTTGEPLTALAVAAAGLFGAAAERAGNDRAASTADAPSSLDSVALTIAAPTAAPARAGALSPTAPLALPANPNGGFDDGFGARIAWMAEQRIGHAQIRLNPEHVGPIDVRVQLDGDRVSAEFHSAHAEVRQAIEASLPRLREMLGQHGMQLGQADVGHGQSGRRGDSMDSHGHDPAREAELDPRLTASPIHSTRGLLDEYA